MSENAAMIAEPEDEVEAPPKANSGQYQPHEVTDEKRAKVRLLAKVASQEAVAAAMEFSCDTLQRYYLDDYREGEREAVTAVKSKLLAAALNGSVNAAWKYLQLKGEVRRTMEVTGPGGGPVAVVDLSRLSDDQLEDYGRLAALAAGVPFDSILIESIESADQP